MDEDEEDTGADPTYMFNPNPNPILTPELLPGFVLSASATYREAGEECVSEQWYSDPPIDSNRLLIKITLYRLKNKAQAFSSAKSMFSATTEKEQSWAVGKPLPGSYSGQLIGDYCWAYKVPADHLPPGLVRQGADLVVIKGSNLFTLSVGDRLQKGVEDSFAEQVAKTIVSRL